MTKKLSSGEKGALARGEELGMTLASIVTEQQ